MARRGIFLIVTFILLAAGLAWLLGRSPAFIPRPVSFIRDLDRNEALVAETGSFLAAAFIRPLRNHDYSTITSALTTDFLARLQRPDEAPAAEEAGLRLRRLDNRAPTVGRDDFIARLKAHADPMAAVERHTMRCFRFLFDEKANRVVASYHWNLGGRTAAQHAIELQADADLELIKSASGWQIRRFELTRARHSIVESPAFVDVTDACGFEFAFAGSGRDAMLDSIDNRLMTSFGGLSAVDWNRDGFTDLLATSHGRRSVLFRNDGKGGFVPESLPEEGALFYLSLDLDGDGEPELVSSKPSWYGDGEAAFGLYTRRGGVWEAKPRTFLFKNPGAKREILSYHIAVSDIDADGRLDLFVVCYSDSHSSRADFNFIDAHGGHRNYLFMNKGGLSFSEEALERGITGTRFHYVAEFFDFEGKGRPDLLVVNDFGPDNYFRNVGGGRFEEDKSHPMAKEPAYGMGLAISDYDNSGEWSVYVANMYSHAGNRIVPLASSLADETRRKLLVTAYGNFLFRRRGGAWAEVGDELEVARGDWAWGSYFFDFDNDSDKDLFVCNGFTSHRDEKLPDY